MPVLTLPLALVGLVGLPMVAAIYFLRSRSRRHSVSSLMLWANQRRLGQAGRTPERMEWPLLLLLELLALTMLVLGAAGPRVIRPDMRSPLVVVLDDSYSMQAGPRQRATDELRELLGEGRFKSVQFIAAGAAPTVLGTSGLAPQQAATALDQWTCRSPTSDLDRALGLAGTLGGPWAKILVLTDRPPETDPSGRVRWLAIGELLPNVAIVNAVRSNRDGTDRCLLEIANLADAPARVSLTVGNVEQSIQWLDLPAAGRQRMVIDAKADGVPITASLAADALGVDNTVVLLPPDTAPVRVQMSLSSAGPASLIERACLATGRAVLVADRPDLVVTDSPLPAARADGAWTLHVLAEEGAQAYIGPFVLDHRHPLADGLGLEGVVWGAAQATGLPGRPVVSAGNVPLLTCRELAGGVREVYLRWVVDQSTLQDTPNWPILLANLLSWRRSASQRLGAVNARLGESVWLTPPAAVTSARLTRPDQTVREVPVRAGRAALSADQVGVFHVEAGGELHRLAVNALCQDESDLRGCGRGQWGDWLDEQTLQTQYVSIAWVFLLVAAGVLGLHGLLVWRQADRRAAP